ncbi:MAG: 1,4-dihydroxy-2-naphthoate polyprenyltransferase [Chloroflexi bacterium]|nr:1,4-dihydroxy-2-naphthoate polyprenyltransferase [Chloroflexota bacterium]
MQRPTPLQVWMLATRPRTLPAAIAPVIVGIAAAIGDGAFQFLPALATLLAALLLQIGANLANDVFDFHKGADARGRLGPPRVTQMGWLTPREMYGALVIVFGMSALLGLYLVAVGGAPILIIGALAILFALGYTAGPFPLAYLGLGDLFAFLFFGLVAVSGTYYLQTHAWNAPVAWAAIPMGLLIAAILDVNNIRDVESDRAVGKKTIAVRFGARVARIEYALLIAGAYLVPLAMGSLALMLTWFSLPLAMRVTRVVLNQQGSALNHALAGTAQLTLVYAILFAIGLII